MNVIQEKKRKVCMSKPLIDRKKLENSSSFTNPQPKSRSGSFRANSKESSFLITEHKEDIKPEKIHKVENEVLPSTDTDEEAPQRDDLASLELDPIFQRLCPKEEYKEDPTCKVCDIKFNALKFRTRKICQFCGNSYCDEHLKRKRASPENPDEFARICTVCDEKYVKRRILQEFEAELNERERVLVYWEEEVRLQQEEIAIQQMELNQIMLEKGRAERNYSEKMTFLTSDIARIKEETKKYDKENAVLTKEFEEMHKRATDWEETILDSKREYQRLLIELSMLNNQIEAVNQDLQLVNKHLKLNNAKELISKRNEDNIPLVMFADKIRKDSISQNDGNDDSMSHYGSQRLVNKQAKKRGRKDEQPPACACTTCNIF